MTKTADFPGFPLGLLHFLEDLSRNNHKAWFDANKQRYEQDCREPALEFIRAIEKPLCRLSPHFVASPKKVGGSLMRVHRDVRFSKDKTPYKTNLAIHFRHELGKDAHAPGYYFHIDTERVICGAGLWRPDSASLAAIRRAIDEEPARWRRAKAGKAFRAELVQEGDTLKRPPRGYPADHPEILDLKRKDHFAMGTLTHDDLFDPDIVAKTMRAYRAGKAYMAFLCAAVGAKF